MKKTHAILLFGSLALLVGSYIAWCTRPMYLGVPMPDLSEVPEPYRQAARKIITDYQLDAADMVSWQRIYRSLRTPYGSDPGKIGVWTERGPDPRYPELKDHFVFFARTPRMARMVPTLVFGTTANGYGVVVDGPVSGFHELEPGKSP